MFLKEILEWRTSREFFYWRLKRRLGENNTIKRILSLQPSIDYQLASNYLQQWFNEDRDNDVRRK
jgi:acetyl-CoA carboxylase/biotin carboxylase 1